MSAQPERERDPLTLQAIRLRAEKMLDREPDPHKVAEKIARDLTDEEARWLVKELLPAFLRTGVVHSKARANLRLANSDASRWTKFAAKPDGFKTVPIFVNGEWRHFGDLTADDLEILALEQEQRASDILRTAKVYRRLAEELRRRGKKRVKELEENIVQGLLA